MAKAAAKAKTAESEDGSAPKKGKGKLFLIIGLVVLLAGGGGGRGGGTGGGVGWIHPFTLHHARGPIPPYRPSLGKLAFCPGEPSTGGVGIPLGPTGAKNRDSPSRPGSLFVYF